MVGIGLNRNIIRVLVALVLATLVAHSVFLYFSNHPAKQERKLVGHHEKALCNFLQSRHAHGNADVPQQKCPETGIVTAFYGGGLDAQMCSYASVLATARTTQLKPFIPTCTDAYLSQVFRGLTIPTLSTIKNCDIPLPEAVQDISNWAGINFSIALPPFYCSFYEVPFIEHIADVFVMHNHIVEQGLHKLQSFRKAEEGTKYVGIHVPMGWKELGDGFAYPDEFFYQKIMGTIRRQEGEKTVFVVVSDCPVRWKCFEGKDVFFSHTSGFPVGLDLAMLSLCNISVVGFEGIGVWAALLTRKNVFAYGSYNEKFKPYVEASRLWKIFR